MNQHREVHGASLCTVSYTHLYGLALRSDANSAPGAPAGERADGNAPLHLLLAGECGRFRFRDELGTDLDITWSDGAVHIEGDYRFPLTWEVLPVEEC